MLIGASIEAKVVCGDHRTPKALLGVGWLVELEKKIKVVPGST